MADERLRTFLDALEEDFTPVVRIHAAGDKLHADSG